MPTRDFLLKLIEVVKKPEDFRITFKLVLSSRNWEFAGEHGTKFNEKDTKELLLGDMEQALYEIWNNKEEIFERCEFESEDQHELDKFEKKAMESYLEEIEYPLIIECLNEEDLEEYKKLHQKIYGDLPFWLR